jgi:hypothetical protein
MEGRNILEYSSKPACLIMLSDSLCCKGLKIDKERLTGLEWKGQHYTSLEFLISICTNQRQMMNTKQKIVGQFT